MCVCTSSLSLSKLVVACLSSKKFVVLGNEKMKRPQIDV